VHGADRPDLAAILGTPEEHARLANGSDGSVTLASGTEIATPEAKVEFDTYTVQLSASYDRLTVADMAGLMGTRAEPRTVLGHPAVLYSDRTLSISFSGDQADSGPGVIARRLLVSRTVKDGSGSFEVILWREEPRSSCAPARQSIMNEQETAIEFGMVKVQGA